MPDYITDKFLLIILMKKTLMKKILMNIIKYKRN